MRTTDWELAAKLSRSKKAISRPFRGVAKGKEVQLVIVISRFAAYYGYAGSPSLAAPTGSRPSTAEIDRVKDWAPY